MTKKEITYYVIIAILVLIGELGGICTLLPVLFLGMLTIYKFVPEIEKEYGYEEKKKWSIYD